tara:strand:+ start:87 stop:1400 length:1314 start_codon:yes stop_codon:yes gene_type:complete
MSQADFQSAHPTGTKDSISSWLDVLTGMLAIPESQRTQVRDEFEDHLRSRIDDLLIVGKPEPEAIRIAIAELGETAELAKLISKAHQHAHPRRRTMNIAMITVAIAGLSIGGISLLTNQSAPPTNQTIPGMIPTLVAVDSEHIELKAEEPTHTFSLELASVNERLTEIAQAFDYELVLSNHARGQKLQSFLWHHKGPLNGEFTFNQAIEYIENFYDEMYYNYDIVISDDTILIQSEEERQRGLVDMQVYPTPEWVLGHSDQEAYAETIRSLLEVKFDLQYTSIKVLNGALIIAAPPKIHAEAHRIMSEVNAVIKHSQEQRLERQQAEEHERNLRRNKLVEEIIREREVLRQSIAINSERRDGFRMKAFYAERALADYKNNAEVSQEKAQELEKQYDSNVRLTDQFTQQVSEDERRLEYLLGRLIESEYIHLDDALNQ